MENPSASGGQRRKLVAGVYNTLDFSDPNDVRKFLAAAAAIVAEVTSAHESKLDLIGSEQEVEEVPPLTQFLVEMKRLGFEWIAGAFVPTSASARLADTKAFAEKMDLAHLGEHIARIERSVENDPPQAIGSAKELVETAAKTILERRGISYPADANLGQLGKLVFAQLQHIPPGILDEEDSKDAIKTVGIMISNLGNVVVSVGAFRNRYGTGHGRVGDRKKLQTRHAKLAVGSAAAIVWYWLETNGESP